MMNNTRPTHTVAKTPENAVFMPSLTVSERLVYLDLILIVRAGLRAFWQVGAALSEIRNSRLYREDYENWDAFCTAEVFMSGRYANNLISATEAREAIITDGTNVPSPTNESQLRPLAHLPESEIVAAWADATTAYGAQPSGNEVSRVVERRSDPALAVIEPDPVRRMVTASGYPAVIGAMEADHLTPRDALTLVDALDACQSRVCEDMVNWGVSDPSFIRAMNKARDSETYAEIVRTGYLQFGDEDEALSVMDARAADLRQLLDLKQKERMLQAIAESRETVCFAQKAVIGNVTDNGVTLVIGGLGQLGAGEVVMVTIERMVRNG